MRPLWRSLAVTSVAFAGAAAIACGGPTGAGAPSAKPAPPADSGVTLAQNSGPTLVVVSLDPAEPGANEVQVEVRDPAGVLLGGAVRVDLSLDGVASSTATLAGGARRGTLAIAHAGRAEIHATVLDGKGAGAAVTLALDVPAVRAPAATLGEIDRAMLALHSSRETQTLTGGGPPLIFHFEYLAPDRVRYTTLSPTGQLSETRLIGRDRFDREGAGAWTHSDLGFPSRVPYSNYAQGATRVRVVGHERDGAQDVQEVAFVQDGATYYRIWVGTADHLVRRYLMMTQGHYMTGAYSDYDTPLAIAAP